MENIDLFQILEEQGELTKIKIFPGYTTQNDPYEKTVTVSYLNPITIKALVSDESMSALKWKYFGQVTYGTKKVVCNIKYENLLKICRKLEIDGEEYTVYKDASVGFAIINKSDYLLFIAEKKV